MTVLLTLLCHSAFYRGREMEEIVTILQLFLQYSKHMQGERLSNDNCTDAAAACTSHPFFSLSSHSLLVWLPKKIPLKKPLICQEKKVHLHHTMLNVIGFHQLERFAALHRHLCNEPAASLSLTCTHNEHLQIPSSPFRKKRTALKCRQLPEFLEITQIQKLN